LSLHFGTRPPGKIAKKNAHTFFSLLIGYGRLSRQVLKFWVCCDPLRVS
jgi:hypothetical protein